MSKNTIFRIDKNNLPKDMDDLVPHEGSKFTLFKGFIQKIEIPEEKHDIEVAVSGNLSMTKNGVTFKDTITKEEIYYTYEDYNELIEKNNQSEERHKQLEERNKQLKIRNRQLRKINKFLDKILHEDPDENFYDKLII